MVTGLWVGVFGVGFCDLVVGVMGMVPLTSLGCCGMVAISVCSAAV